MLGGSLGSVSLAFGQLRCFFVILEVFIYCLKPSRFGLFALPAAKHHFIKKYLFPKFNFGLLFYKLLC